MIVEDSTRRRSYAQIGRASIGLTIVALVCATSGLAYGTGTPPSASDLELIAEYGFLIYPYFLSREISLEGLPRPAEQQRDLGLFVPLVFFGFAIALVVLWTGWQSIPSTQWIGVTSFENGLIFLLVVAVFPFIYLFIRTQMLIRNPDSAERERLFKNKILLPALATCLVSFSFGWAINNPNSIAAAMATPIILIVVLKEISVKWQTPILWTVLGFLTLLSAAFALFLETGSRIGLIFIIGIILTLAMGVAEVCKRVVRFPRHGVTTLIETRDGHIISEDYDFYLSGANWSSVLFPLLLCLIPLVIFELPVVPIFLILSAQYLHWHFFAPKKKSPILFWFNVFLGFMLPIVVLVQYLWPMPTVLFTGKDHLDGFFGLLIAAITVITGTLTAVNLRQVRRFLTNITSRDSYLNPNNCFLFFCLFFLQPRC